MHKRRVQRTGTTDDPRATWDVRLWSKIDRSGGPGACWPWTGSTTASGYGQFWMLGTMVKPHRLAYTLVVGPIPAGHVLDHTCHDPAVCDLGDRCPHRRCCNPRHAEPVTVAVNVGRERSAKSRRPKCRHGHTWDGTTNTYGYRICRPCIRAADRRRIARDPDKHRRASRESMARRRARLQQR